MKIVILLLALFLGFGFACKNTFDSGRELGNRLRTEASLPDHELAVQPQAIASL